VRRGDVLAESQSIVLNSAYLFRADTPAERPTDLAFRYDKNHLVPFGEYVPLKEWLGFLGQVVPFPKGFTPGPRPNLMEAGGRRFGILICFEDAFPRLVRRYVNRPEGRGAEFLVNISNDGWFRGSHELDQHWSLCVFRAIEFRIGIVRSVNSGISGIIHPTGRVQARVTDARGRFKLVEGTAVGRVHLREGLTVYARIGDVFALVCLLFGALALAAGIAVPIAARLRRRSGHRAHHDSAPKNTGKE
jgi:apolipoprotein N-acyltransferase